MQLRVEVEGMEQHEPLPGQGAGLAAFCSFAAMRGFGAQHPLLQLIERFDVGHGIRIGPFTTFYDASVEDAEDAEKIELAWQAPQPLEAAAEAAARALHEDEEAARLARDGGTPALATEMEALARAASRAAAAGARIRMTYLL
jgi:hypothetical protein